MVRVEPGVNRSIEDYAAPSSGVCRPQCRANFDWASNRVDSASDLAAGANLWCIAHVDHHGVSLFNHVTGVIRRDLRNRRVSRFQHLSDACYHLILLWSGTDI